MSTHASLPLPHTLASDMAMFELDEALCLLMESATEAAEGNNGELPDELRGALLEYCEAFGVKVDNIANYIKSQEDDARNARREIDRLQSRATTAENRVERLKGLVKYFMQTRNLRNLKGRLNTISIRNNSQDSLIVNQPHAIPTEYWRVSVTIGLAEWQGLLNSLPDQHELRTRFGSGSTGSITPEPDNTKLRSALASGTNIQGAELRRGQHIRLT
jgi:Siphovirus Gp157